jgi:hypothetical protein
MAATTPITTAPVETAGLVAPEDGLFDGDGTDGGVAGASAGVGDDGTTGAARHVGTKLRKVSLRSNLARNYEAY